MSESSRSASLDRAGSDSLGAIVSYLDRSSAVGNESITERSRLPGRQAMQSPDSTRTPKPCQCLRAQADKLCSLRTIEQRQTPVKVDTILTCLRVVSRATEYQLQCLSCQNDTHTLFLTMMIFQVVFRWVGMQTHRPEIAYDDPSIKMGQYKISRQETQLLKNILVSQAFDKTQKALKMLQARVNQVVMNAERREPWDLERGEVQNFQPLFQSLMQTSLTLANRFQTRIT